jgi:hypothetical protein
MIKLKSHRIYYNKTMVLMVAQAKLGVVFQGLKHDMEKWLPCNWRFATLETT